MPEKGDAYCSMRNKPPESWAESPLGLTAECVLETLSGKYGMADLNEYSTCGHSHAVETEELRRSGKGP